MLIKIQAGVIDASKLNVSSLDAITANVGNLTGGTITGGTFKMKMVVSVSTQMVISSVLILQALV